MTIGNASGYQNGPMEMAAPRRFLLQRKQDISGVSGTGLVASGVLWGDGSVAVHWHTRINSHVVFTGKGDLTGFDMMLALHGHSGATEVEWLDPE